MFPPFPPSPKFDFPPFLISLSLLSRFAQVLYFSMYCNKGISLSLDNASWANQNLPQPPTKHSSPFSHPTSFSHRMHTLFSTAPHCDPHRRDHKPPPPCPVLLRRCHHLCSYSQTKPPTTLTGKLELENMKLSFFFFYRNL